MLLRQMNHSDSCWFACFCKSVNVGKENFDIVMLLFFWSKTFFHCISVEAFPICGDEIAFVVR